MVIIQDPIRTTALVIIAFIIVCVLSPLSIPVQRIDSAQFPLTSMLSLMPGLIAKSIWEELFPIGYPIVLYSATFPRKSEEMFKETSNRKLNRFLFWSWDYNFKGNSKSI